MRSSQSDQRGGSITFSAGFDGINLASGSGVAQPGSIPFSWVRSSQGNYSVRFDSRLIPSGYNANVNGGFFFSAVGPNVSPGSISFAVLDANGAMQNGIINFTCTARDTR
jgi:hypothetical protein